MPTYEYLCQSCGARFEAWQKITDDPIDTCPTCGAHVRRVIFPVGLVFKGSGFYINDNRSSSASAVPAASNGESAGSGEAKSSEGAANTASAASDTKAGSTTATKTGE